MEDYGGEFIMMSDEPDVIEGEWSGRLVVMKFPGADADPHAGPGAGRVSGHRTTGVICGHGQRRRLEEVTGKARRGGPRGQFRSGRACRTTHRAGSRAGPRRGCTHGR